MTEKTEPSIKLPTWAISVITIILGMIGTGIGTGAVANYRVNQHDRQFEEINKKGSVPHQMLLGQVDTLKERVVKVENEMLGMREALNGVRKDLGEIKGDVKTLLTIGGYKRDNIGELGQK